MASYSHDPDNTSVASPDNVEVIERASLSVNEENGDPFSPPNYETVVSNTQVNLNNSFTSISSSMMTNYDEYPLPSAPPIDHNCASPTYSFSSTTSSMMTLPETPTTIYDEYPQPSAPPIEHNYSRSTDSFSSTSSSMSTPPDSQSITVHDDYSQPSANEGNYPPTIDAFSLPPPSYSEVMSDESKYIK